MAIATYPIDPMLALEGWNGFADTDWNQQLRHTASM
jgi:hypothetical protein